MTDDESTPDQNERSSRSSHRSRAASDRSEDTAGGGTGDGPPDDGDRGVTRTDTDGIVSGDNGDDGRRASPGSDPSTARDKHRPAEEATDMSSEPGLLRGETPAAGASPDHDDEAGAETDSTTERDHESESDGRRQRPTIRESDSIDRADRRRRPGTNRPRRGSQDRRSRRSEADGSPDGPSSRTGDRRSGSPPGTEGGGDSESGRTSPDTVAKTTGSGRSEEDCGRSERRSRRRPPDADRSDRGHADRPGISTTGGKLSKGTSVGDAGPGTSTTDDVRGSPSSEDGNAAGDPDPDSDPDPVPLTTVFELYSTVGEPVATNDPPGTGDPAIAAYFRGDVYLTVEPLAGRNGVEVTCIVRATESGSDRLNSFYVRFDLTPEDDTGVVKRELKRFLTERVGLSMASRDVPQAAVVRDPWAVSPQLHLAEDAAADLKRALAEDDDARAEFLVPDQQTGLEATMALVEAGVTDSVALVDSEYRGISEDFEAVVRTSDGSSVTLAPDSREFLTKKRREWTDRRVEDHLETICGEVRALRHETALNDAAIRCRVAAELPTVGPADRVRARLRRLRPGASVDWPHRTGDQEVDFSDRSAASESATNQRFVPDVRVGLPRFLLAAATVVTTVVAGFWWRFSGTDPPIDPPPLPIPQPVLPGSELSWTLPLQGPETPPMWSASLCEVTK